MDLFLRVAYSRGSPWAAYPVAASRLPEAESSQIVLHGAAERRRTPFTKSERRFELIKQPSDGVTLFLPKTALFFPRRTRTYRTWYRTCHGRGGVRTMHNFPDNGGHTAAAKSL